MNKKTIEVMLVNTLKVLSAVFDKYGGEIELYEDILENAEIGFYVEAEKSGSKIILKKKSGKSPIYDDLIKNNKN